MFTSLENRDCAPLEDRVCIQTWIDVPSWASSPARVFLRWSLHCAAFREPPVPKLSGLTLTFGKPCRKSFFYASLYTFQIINKKYLGKIRNEQFSKLSFRLIYWLTSLYLSNKIAIRNRPIYSNSPHVTPLNSWPAFLCIGLFKALQACLQHLASLVKTNDFNDNWTWRKILLKHLYLVDYYKMFENLIKINFVDNCKIYTSLSTCPIFGVVSMQKGHSYGQLFFLFVSGISFASCGYLLLAQNTEWNIYRNFRNDSFSNFLKFMFPKFLKWAHKNL